ncbi:hypothetical protein [Enterococcus lactis]
MAPPIAPKITPAIQPMPVAVAHAAATPEAQAFPDHATNIPL